MLRPLFAALTAVSALLMILPLSGCHSDADAGASINTPVSTAQQITEIQNNPHMPPQAKAAALAQIKNHPTTGGQIGGAPTAEASPKK